MYRQLGELVKSASFGNWRLNQLNAVLRGGNAKAAKLSGTIKSGDPYDVKCDHIKKAMALEQNRQVQRATEGGVVPPQHVETDHDSVVFLRSERSPATEKVGCVFSNRFLRDHAKNKPIDVWPDDRA